MAITSGPERVEKMAKVLENWQKLERKAMDDAAAIIEESENALRILGEIDQRIKSSTVSDDSEFTAFLFGAVAVNG